MGRRKRRPVHPAGPIDRLINSAWPRCILAAEGYQLSNGVFPLETSIFLERFPLAKEKAIRSFDFPFVPLPLSSVCVSESGVSEREALCALAPSLVLSLGGAALRH